jgi:hypothetical protein
VDSESPLPTEDDERLAQLLGPARAMLGRVEIMTLGTRRAMSTCLLGSVFCLSAAVGAGALIFLAPTYDRAVILAGVTVFIILSALFAYGIAVMRFDLVPLNAFSQELRAGIRSAEQTLFKDWPELQS